MPASPHNAKSSYRETVLRHVLVGELLRGLWLAGRPAEVLTPEVDDAGYDLVVGSGPIIRHVQLKTSHVGSSTASVKVNVRLAEKPSACVVWTIFDPETMQADRHLWFGGEPGQPLPSLDGLKVAKHSKANAEGVKAERPGVRVLPKGRFEVLDSAADLIDRLFG